MASLPRAGKLGAAPDAEGQLRGEVAETFAVLGTIFGANVLAEAPDDATVAGEAGAAATTQDDDDEGTTDVSIWSAITDWAAPRVADATGCLGIGAAE
mmetsp:Transcript_107305/g.269062  ORF Transcript_107305/g.269062 Transcript_107305/m.269062 type:complete len:98 (+) Transcript_107305:1214-1507(+)